MQEQSQSLRIVFAGTPAFSAAHLQALLQAELNIVAVYTQPDRPGKRGKHTLPGPVKQLANLHSIPVCQPSSLRTDSAVAELATWNPDLMVVVAYGLLLPQKILDAPRLGCINVHASILPRWRGAAPVERAIEAGDTSTGVTIMQMDAGLDTGAILRIDHCPIAIDETGDSLREKLARLGSHSLLATLALIGSGQQTATPQQDDLKTYAHKLSKGEACIDWRSDASLLERRIRAFNSSNVMYSEIENLRVKVWQSCVIARDGRNAAPGEIIHIDKNSILVACGSDALALEKLQLPGGKVQSIATILNGHADKFLPGFRFSN